MIGQDRSANAIELQKVIDDTLPLLQAVQPQDLSYTLGAVADALRGRGKSLGENLASTGEYVGQVNTVLPQLQADISELADFADTYQGAADDLLAVLDNLSITNKTLVDQKEQLRRTFTVVAASPNVTRGLPEDQRAEPDLAGPDLPPGAGRVREVLAGVPLPAQRADPVQPDDQRGLRWRRRSGAEPEHHRQPAAAQPLRAG